ncbi:MAG: CsgG/HfaB family protein [Planctomycetota bacterium]
MLRFSVTVTVGLALAVLVGGCATSTESAQPDTITAHVGVYSAAPPALRPVRVGVPSFKDATRQERPQGASEDLGDLAADQLITLAVNTDRFDVIERAQLEKLLTEQGLEGIVDPSELAQPGRVRGVDYLFIGKVTNFRVKVAQTRTGLGIAKVALGQAGGAGGFDLKKDTTRITVDCGVDLRLVNPSTGATVAAQFGEYKKTDTVGAMGVEVLGARATAQGDVMIDEDSHGKILRLALDHAVRRMLPKLDRRLLQIQNTEEKPSQ